MGTKYKREETKLGLSLNTLLTSLNIDISSMLRSRLESRRNQTSTAYGISMNFFVITHEIREINKQGGQKKMRGVGSDTNITIFLRIFRTFGDI